MSALCLLCQRPRASAVLPAPLQHHNAPRRVTDDKMASLLDRIQPLNSGAGPVRNRGGQRSVSLPYERPPNKRQKEDDVMVWKHDMYKGPGGDLGSRLAESSTSSKRIVDASGADLAVRSALGMESRRMGGGSALSIRGASSAGSNVVQVENLESGTSAADVESIFRSCGTILESHVHGRKDLDAVTVRLKFKSTEDAQKAILAYNGKSADGNKLKVSVVGSAGTSLGGRFGNNVALGGNVDVLMDDGAQSSGSGSKMRSDELLSDPRAQVLTVPPGVDPAEYQARGRGRGGGRRGRGGRGGRGGGAKRVRGANTGSAMVVD